MPKQEYPVTAFAVQDGTWSAKVDVTGNATRWLRSDGHKNETEAVSAAADIARSHFNQHHARPERRKYTVTVDDTRTPGAPFVDVTRIQ